MSKYVFEDNQVDQERQIMDTVYTRGQATAVEVLQSLSDPPSKTAIRTLMRILEEKGHLKHVQEGAEIRLSSDSAANLSVEEIRRLTALVEQVRNQHE